MIVYMAIGGYTPPICPCVYLCSFQHIRWWPTKNQRLDCTIAIHSDSSVQFQQQFCRVLQYRLLGCTSTLRSVNLRGWMSFHWEGSRCLFLITSRPREISFRVFRHTPKP